MSGRLVVFALGNPIRADDGAGLAVAQGLEALLPDLDVVEAQELLPEHADAVVGARGILFLDASVAGSPGDVRASRLVPRAAREAILHALMPEEILGLARAAHGQVPPAALVTISGREFSFGDALSAEVEAALPLAREKAREFADTFGVTAALAPPAAPQP